MVTTTTRSVRHASAGPASTRHHAQLLTTVKRNHKVIMEEVTQHKKSLVTVEYHKLDPPNGYTFVPAGDPELTAKCKEFARLKGSTVYVVSTSGPRGNELSQQVHRVGYHFPTDIVTRACNILDIDLDQLDDFLRKHEEWPEEKPRRANLTRSKKSKKSAAEKKGMDLKGMSQAELDRQARSAILDMFPTIPKDNMDEIVDHAFLLGSDRVGVQVSDLSLPRRAQLAVVAHIRHTYTEYDELLREMSWAEARRMVASKTLEKLALWRGDKDDEPDTMEDILREVVVISDDEDDEGHEISRQVSRPESPHARARADEQDRSLDRVKRGDLAYTRPLPNKAGPTATMLADDGPQAPVEFQRSEAQNHRRYERIQAWEQARSRLRQNGRPPIRLDPERAPPRAVPNDRYQMERQIPHRIVDPTRDLTNGQEAVDGHFQYKNDDFRRYDNIKEAVSRPYDSSRPLQAVPVYRSDTFSTRPTSAFHYGEVSRAGHDSSLQSLQEGFVAQPMLPRVPNRHPATAETDPEIVVPSIESPRSIKHDDMVAIEGNNTAIMVDSPTHERQLRYGRAFPAEPYNRPYHVPLKRRREASPIRLQESSRQVLLQSSNSTHHAQHRPPLSLSGRNEERNQGNVTYLPLKEDIGYPVNSSRANFSSSQKSLTEDEQYRRRQPLPNFSYGSSVIEPQGIYLKDNGNLAGPFSKELSGPLVRTRNVLGAQDGSDPQFEYYDHSGRQIYITGRPAVEPASAQSQAENKFHLALDRNVTRIREPISTGQGNPSLQGLPLGQSSLQNQRSDEEQVGARYEPLRVIRVARDVIPHETPERRERLVLAAQDHSYATGAAPTRSLHHRPEMRGSHQINVLAPGDMGRSETQWPMQRRLGGVPYSTQAAPVQRARYVEDIAANTHNRHQSAGVIMLD